MGIIPETMRAVVAFDKENIRLREKLAEVFSEMGDLRVSYINDLAIQDINREIGNAQPQLIFFDCCFLTGAYQMHPEKFNELKGLICRVRRKMDKQGIAGKIVIRGPEIDKDMLEEVFNQGADAWIGEEMAYEYLTGAFKSVLSGEDFMHPYFRRKQEVK